MPSAGSRAEGKVLEILASPAGLGSALAAIRETESADVHDIPPEHMVRQNIPADLAEKSTGGTYPSVHVYCEKLSNTLREKFRRVSGRARMVSEVRVSQDRLEGIERRLQLYADAVMRVLDSSRGSWGGGLFYAGGYEAEFSGVRRGGRNFLQIAKISFDVEVSE